MEPKPFTVEKVLGTNGPIGQYGNYAHDLILTGAGKCQWLSKQEQPPAVGEQLIGIVEESEYGLKFKKQLPQQQNLGNGNSERGFGWQTNPVDAKRMSRSHAQEMALRYAEVQGLRGKLPDDFKLDHLTPIIDWFQKDVDA